MAAFWQLFSNFVFQNEFYSISIDFYNKTQE